MPEWVLVLVAGAIGGLVSMLLVEGGLMVPTMFTDAQGHRHWHLGTAGRVVVGAVAAVVFWGLYTPDLSFTSPATVRPVLGSLVAGLVACLSARAGHPRRTTVAMATEDQRESGVRREAPDEMPDFIHEMCAVGNPRKQDQRSITLDEASKRLSSF